MRHVVVINEDRTIKTILTQTTAIKFASENSQLFKQALDTITVRDIVVISACILWEHTSLRAFPFLFKNWRNVLAKRQEIMARKKVDDAYIASWFDFQPVSKPAPKKSVASLTRAAKATRR